LLERSRSQTLQPVGQLMGSPVLETTVREVVEVGALQTPAYLM
jgi:hypothetical protein